MIKSDSNEFNDENEEIDSRIERKIKASHNISSMIETNKSLESANNGSETIHQDLFFRDALPPRPRSNKN